MIEYQKKGTFLQAYNQINERFNSIFTKLTGGGKGWLQLQDSEDPFNGGLDIFVQFPGKSSRLITGASGGEKSVTAVSFIFSIQNLFPAPFYILDEIDAHLDPFNAEKLSDLLKEQSIDSQFILISLRDVLIESAERIFGLYVQNGISRFVSVKLAEVKV